jgi:hypothetical protein
MSIARFVIGKEKGGRLLHAVTERDEVLSLRCLSVLVLEKF